MERRSIIAIVAAILFYYAWLMWVQSTTPPPAEAPVPEGPAAPVVPGAPATAAPVVAGPERVVAFDWCDVKSTWSSRSGGMSASQIDGYTAPFQVTPIWRFVIDAVSGGPTSWVPYGEDTGPAQSLPKGSAGIVAGSGPIGPASATAAFVEARPERLEMRRVTADGLEVSTTVTPGESCAAQVDVVWSNPTAEPVAGPLWVGVWGHLPKDTSRYAAAIRPVLSIDGSTTSLDDLEDLDDEPVIAGDDGFPAFFGLADTYFATFLVPRADEGAGGFSRVAGPDGPLEGAHQVLSRALAPGESHRASYLLFAGPKSSERLVAVDPRLEDAVQLGFFGFFGRILLWLLHFLHGFVGNWGLSIICLTVLVKAVFFPLTQMSFKSSQAMQAVQPKVAELRETHKDDPEELNRQMLKLWRENGVNPLGGCLPMLVQLPVWISLYQVLLTSVDLYHTRFVYLHDLSAPDPYGALPIAAIVLMAIQQQMMPMANMDPVQARILKFMPIAFGVLFFTFPSGLVVYIFVNTVLTMMQQWLIKRSFAVRTVTQGSAA